MEKRSTKTALSYSIITPVFDEAENLGRLVETLAGQTLPPERWVVVDTGSRDETASLARGFASIHPWIAVENLALGQSPTRGGPIVKAFHAGISSVPETSDIIVKLDADISFERDHFERLLREFDCEPTLGIASGVVYEQDEKAIWRQRHGTGPGVWGAARAYRRTCLEAILPLDERMGWDTIDLISARVRGFTTRVVPDLPFFHHRVEGDRDRNRFTHWTNQGRAAHYMGYRPSYLVIRTVFRCIRDPAAVGLLYGFLRASLSREPQCADTRVVGYVRREQSVGRLPRRIREALRPRRRLDRTSPPA